MTKSHEARPVPDDDAPSPLPFPSLSGPLEDLAATTSGLLRRAGVEPAELGAMFDALGTLFHSDRAEARLTLGQPVYALVPNDEDRWMVVRMEDGDEHVLANVMAKRTAVDMARRRARDAGGTLVVHRLDGSVQSTYHYGAPAADRDGLASTGELVSLDAHRT